MSLSFFVDEYREIKCTRIVENEKWLFVVFSRDGVF